MRAPCGTRTRRSPCGALVGFGKLAGTVVRIDHTGQRARLMVVLDALESAGSCPEQLV